MTQGDGATTVKRRLASCGLGWMPATRGDARRRRASLAIPALATPFAVLIPALVVGCSQSLRPVFEEPQTPLVWPAAPDEPRIRYLGQLESAADLKAPEKPFQALGNLLVGPTAPQPLYGPRGVACTSDGNGIWVADPGGRCVHRFDLADRTYRKIVRIADRPFLSPVAVCAGPADSVFVCDSENVSLVRLDARDGRLLNSLPLPEELLRPVGLAFDFGAEELYVVDAGAHNIKVMSADGTLLRTIGARGSAAGQFNFPCGIAVADSMIWVADSGNHRVQGLSFSGESAVSIGQAGDAPGDLALPKSVAVDLRGHVYVVDARFENVQIFDRQGRLLLVFGQEGTGPGEFWLPGGIYIDALDRIWVCDAYNRRIQVFQLVTTE